MPRKKNNRKKIQAQKCIAARKNIPRRDQAPIRYLSPPVPFMGISMVAAAAGLMSTGVNR